MVNFWHSDAVDYPNPVTGYIVRLEAKEAIHGGADGLVLVAQSFAPSAYVAKDMIENNDTEHKHWEDVFSDLVQVILQER